MLAGSRGFILLFFSTDFPPDHSLWFVGILEVKAAKFPSLSMCTYCVLINSKTLSYKIEGSKKTPSLDFSHRFTVSKIETNTKFLTATSASYNHLQIDALIGVDQTG